MFMKKKMLLFIALLSLVVVIFPNNKVSASENSATEEDISETIVTEGDIIEETVEEDITEDDEIEEDIEQESVPFEELSEEDQSFFLSQGFSEDNEFFQSTEVQQPDTAGNFNQRAIMNIITITGATKKQNTTTAYTTYIVTSNMPMLKISTKATLKGHKGFSSTVLPYKSPSKYGGGIYSTYTGSKKYFSVKLDSQVTTQLGTKSTGSSAGGVTLGK